MHTHAKAFAAAMFVQFIFGGFIADEANGLNEPAAFGNSFIAVEDEPDPDEVRARVARVSVVSGDARIRRSDSDEWESVTLNLPVVEGDEIVTETGARIELQLAKDQHIRLSENSSMKIVTYSDEGVAVSLSSGTMHIRLRSFNKDRFYEIDAPKTTMAIQAAGSYRIDAGAIGASEVRVAAANGEARIYTNCLLVILNGFVECFGRSLVPVELSLQVQLVSFIVLSVVFGQPFLVP
jgi:hypothetical protein